MNLKEFFKVQLQDLGPELKSDLEHLILETLKLQRIDLHIGAKTLSESEVNLLNQSIVGLKSGKPLAYILKSQNFMGLDFYVDQRVLIPRPETEHLVDLCLQTFQSQNLKSFSAGTDVRSKIDTDLKILDVGAGSGCIGISILIKRSNSSCVFIEKSKEAVEVLKINLDRHEINPKRYQIYKSLEGFEKSNLNYKMTFDLFISNPPYIGRNDEKLESSVLKFEPSIALFAEDHGLYFLKTWSLKAIDYLKPNLGYAIFEFGEGQDQALQAYALAMGFKSEIILDQYQKPRFWKIRN